MTILKKAIEQLAKSGDSPYPRSAHCKRDDSISVFMSGERYYTRQIDALLTVHYSFESEEMVGCTIANVSMLAQNYKHFFEIQDEGVELRFLLYSLSCAVQEKEKHHVWNLSEKLGTVRIPNEALFQKAA